MDQVGAHPTSLIHNCSYHHSQVSSDECTRATNRTKETRDRAENVTGEDEAT